MRIIFSSALCLELFSPTIYDSDVYASSIASGSKPSFAVDADFNEPTPTCFQTDSRTPDVEGLHWLLIDFGSLTRNIREIRLVTEISSKPTTYLKDVESFIIGSLDSSREEVNRTDITNKNTLQWESPSFQYCSKTTTPEDSRPTITLRCAQPLDGRWMAIRSSNALNVCFISIYVEHAFDNCYQVLQQAQSIDYTGVVFRYMRHVSQNECREACLKAPMCEAVHFQRDRFSGTCQMIHSFGKFDDSQGNKNGGGKLLCEDKRCFIDVNRCHEGLLKQMKRISNASSDAQSDFGIFHQTEEWELIEDKRSTIKPINQSTAYLVSVSFEGKLICSDWDCGLVYVYSVDSKGSETICTFVNTEQLTVLEKRILFCDMQSSPVDSRFIRLKWKPPQLEESFDQLAPSLKFAIVRGYARVSKKRPTTSLPLTTETTSSQTTASVSISDNPSVKPPSGEPEFDEHSEEQPIVLVPGFKEYMAYQNEVKRNQENLEITTEIPSSAPVLYNSTTPAIVQNKVDDKDNQKSFDFTELAREQKIPAQNYPVNDEQAQNSKTSRHHEARHEIKKATSQRAASAIHFDVQHSSFKNGANKMHKCLVIIFLLGNFVLLAPRL
ncbi:hypothetical protein EG68_02160 [Paragonimus skrjabini miyazakii]|uniref:Apple domain-containing protein n=1 Tax=Paragonimus skrjabini miyazakii TaxID=59628 RepID=A0A8S9Z0M4_9TREM|nr:hypothetical protein EG68_02160 [Paragonimus skrjabini miyazakii]